MNFSSFIHHDDSACPLSFITVQFTPSLNVVILYYILLNCVSVVSYMLER